MNAQAAVLRREIEAKLVHRIPGALSPSVQQVPRLQPTGNARLDALLIGGLPLGSVCEVTGVDGSGRSSIALSVLASVSCEGACAYIDVSDALSPQSAAAAGVHLRNLLWVRFAEKRPSATPKSTAGAPAQEVDTRREQRQLAQQHCGILHPRGETKDLAPALEQMLFYKEERRRLKMEGTPGYPNQPLGLHTASQDQVEWERFNIRYSHPLLEPVLRRTLGVPLFQEQLLRIAMVIADFTGGEAEELRRALGSRRSADKMRALEVKLRAGMDANGVGPKAQEEIILAISSFALYGFPESHAASFALIAYASAWLKLHYLPVFTAAILNNQPMGFYSAAVLVKDAQRHGLRIKPVDVTCSDWNCTLEPEPEGAYALRLGLRYVRGLRASVATEIERVRSLRPFGSIEELARRVPALSQADLDTFAETGALNALGKNVHRRDALWQVSRAGRQAGPLFSELDQDEEKYSPLQAMSPEERLVADYAGTGITVGRHPMAHCRMQLRQMNILRAGDLKLLRHGVPARIAGCVIARQRPGTAHGFIFLSLEDESGISNAIVDPDLYEANRSLVTYGKVLLIEGTLQNVEKVIHIRSKHIEELHITAAPMVSHDFH